MHRDILTHFSGWRSRGYIPHFDQPDLIQLVTIRLYDAVPEALIGQWKRELAWVESISASDPRYVALRKRIEKYEDAGHGACWLREDRIASIVEQALLYFDGERYRIIAWCIMPNHAHVIIEIWADHPLAGIAHSWKSYTAHEANKSLHISGTFWFREYHDRYVRDEGHLENAVEYVENNPVKAGLVRTKEEWKWSSARERSRPGGPAEWFTPLQIKG
jgi:REP element-mobilizing transposase RayT